MILAVDPGMNTGWCFMENGEVVASGVKRVPKELKGKDVGEVFVLNSFWEWFSELVKAVEVNTFIIEVDEMYAGSAKSHAFFAKNVGKMERLIGGYMRVWAEDVDNLNIVMTTARKWKGQLTDDATRTRVELITGKKYRQHEADAVGMGLNYFGKF